MADCEETKSRFCEHQIELDSNIRRWVSFQDMGHVYLECYDESGYEFGRKNPTMPRALRNLQRLFIVDRSSFLTSTNKE